MGKIKLNLDDLKVQSFHTTSEVTGEGSVFGYYITDDFTCDPCSTGDGPCVVNPSDISQCYDPTCTDTGVYTGAFCTCYCTTEGVDC